nr:MAG TPA: tail-needle protein [Caudoviricetes sp.]
MEKKLNIWNDYQNQKNYDLSFKTVDDNAPDNIVLTETKDDRGKNGEQWNFKIVSKDYIDTKNAEQDETARQQQAQITEHSHTLREHEEKIVKIEEKNTEQDGKLTELENKNTEQDGKLTELENKNTEQDGKLTEHENRLEQLDGGHTSNLGKIGEIETTLDDHKGRLELLETETENYSPRIYRVHLQNMELKKENSIVKCTIDVLASLDRVEQHFSVHLSGILTIDEKNNHNNVLQLSSDNIFNEHIYNIELSNDDSLVVNIIHSKKIEIKKVTISEFSQITISKTLNIENKNENTANNDYIKPLVFDTTRGFKPEFDNGYEEAIHSITHFIKIDDSKTLIDINCLAFITLMTNDSYTGFEFKLVEYLNDYFKFEVVPNNILMRRLLLDESLVIINDSSRYLTEGYLNSDDVKEGKSQFQEFVFRISRNKLKKGTNKIEFRVSFVYDSKAPKKPVVEEHL